MRLSYLIIALLFHAATYADSFKEQEFVVKNGNIKLPGTIYCNESYSTPIIVLVHGSGPNDRDETIGPNKMFKEFAEEMTLHNIATLRYDKRTFLYKNGADTITYHEETVDDAIHAIQQLHDMGFNNIFVAGHSLGGYLAPKIASATKNMLRGVILLSANSSSLENCIKAQINYLGPKQGMSDFQIQQTIQQLLQSLPTKYLEYDRTYSPKSFVKTLLNENPELRWLIVQGGHDYQVTIADLMMWQQLFRTQAQYYYGDNLDHLLRPLPDMATPEDYMKTGNIDKKVVKVIADFILSSTK